MKPQFTKYGPAADYRGAHVTLTLGDRVYLGEIVDVQRSEVRGLYIATVRHFNGEIWKDGMREFRPCLAALDIIERTYDEPKPHPADCPGDCGAGGEHGADSRRRE